MRKTALLLGLLALMFPVPIICSYGPPSIYSTHFFKVSLADDDPLLSLRIRIRKDDEIDLGPPLPPICSDCPFEADVFGLIHGGPTNPFITYFH